MNLLLSQLPQLPPGAIESWLLSAAAVAVIAGSIKKLLPSGKTHDGQFVTREEFRSLLEAIEKLRTDLLAEEKSRQARLSAIEASLARLDERTRSKAS